MNQYFHVEQEEYKKDYLIKKYNNFLLEKKVDKENFEKCIYDVLVNKKIKDGNNIKEKSIIIDIESPEIISKTKLLENIFTIYISQKIIDKYKSKDYYKLYFDNLNKLNRKYSLIYYVFGDKKKINYLKELNIDFNKIRSINLIQHYEDNEEEEEENEYYREDNNKNFFENLFSINNIDNNLIYLEINFIEGNIIEPNIFKKINKFKSLRYLYLNNFQFVDFFTIKLENITILSCKKCKNIRITENFDIKLEKLHLEENEILNIDILKNGNLKELKELNLNNNNIEDIKVLEKVKFEKLEIINLEKN